MQEINTYSEFVHVYVDYVGHANPVYSCYEGDHESVFNLVSEKLLNTPNVFSITLKTIRDVEDPYLDVSTTWNWSSKYKKWKKYNPFLGE